MKECSMYHNIVWGKDWKGLYVLLYLQRATLRSSLVLPSVLSALYSPVGVLLLCVSTCPDHVYISITTLVTSSRVSSRLSVSFVLVIDILFRGLARLLWLVFLLSHSLDCWSLVKKIIRCTQVANCFFLYSWLTFSSNKLTQIRNEIQLVRFELSSAYEVDEINFPLISLPTASSPTLGPKLPTSDISGTSA